MILFFLICMLLSIASCAVLLCCGPKGRAGAPAPATAGQFKWKQPPKVMIGGRASDEGTCQALVQTDNSNIWQIVLSDDQGRVDHLVWKKSEPYGSWDEVGSQDSGNWWLEKVDRQEYRGWITSIKYPGQKLQATLTLRY